MTTIEQIRIARQEMDASFKRLIKSCYEGPGVRAADLEVLQYEVSKTISAQALALVQATQVADENFERAQKLADQVHDNVKHIERMAQQLEGKVVHLPEWHDKYESGDRMYWADQVHKALYDAGVRYD